MEKINLSVQRSFSDLITVTINFMKQEFVPFIRAFAVIGFPMILLMLFFMKDLLMGVFDMSLHPEAYYDVNNFGDTMLRTLFTSLFGVLMMLWVQLFAISYLRVYWDHYQAGIEERITIIEVFRVMLRKFGVYLVWSVFCGLVVFVGLLCWGLGCCWVCVWGCCGCGCGWVCWGLVGVFVVVGFFWVLGLLCCFCVFFL